jgi:hypothetical protein
VIISGEDATESVLIVEYIELSYAERGVFNGSYQIKASSSVLVDLLIHCHVGLANLNVTCCLMAILLNSTLAVG